MPVAPNLLELLIFTFFMCINLKLINNHFCLRIVRLPRYRFDVRLTDFLRVRRLMFCGRTADQWEANTSLLIRILPQDWMMPVEHPLGECNIITTAQCVINHHHSSSNTEEGSSKTSILASYQLKLLGSLQYIAEMHL